MKDTPFFPKIGNGERKLVWTASVIAMVLGMVAPIVGLSLAAVRGQFWDGIQFLSPGDFGVYLSNIAQAEHGALALKNLYNTAPLAPVINVFWYAVGRLGALLSVGPLAAFHIARTLLIPALAWTAYAACASFIDDLGRRKAAFLLFMFGSGVGVYFAPLFVGAVPAGGTYQWPIDMWVSESNAFMSMVYSPHFIASFALILLVVLALRRAFATGRVAHAFVAGLLGLVLFQFHPFHAPTLYAVFFVYLVVESLLARRIDGRRWAMYVVFVAVSAPSVVYHYVLSTLSPAAHELVAANLTITPSLLQVAIGFGFIGVFAAVALPATWRSGERGRFLVVWAAVQLALIYGPLTFQRRLIEGLEFPLVVMASLPLVATFRWFHRGKIVTPASAEVLAVFMAFVMFTPSSFAAVARNVDGYVNNEPPIFFRSADQHEVLADIRDRTPADAAFLGSIGSGEVIAGWADRTVYVGHWVNSGHVKAKEVDVYRFFSSMDDRQRAAFMKDNGLTYVFVGPAERRYGGPFGGNSFVLAFSVGPYSVYRFEPASP